MKNITRTITAVLIIAALSTSALSLEICKRGYLDSFVKPTTEGGWGLPAWIVSIMTEKRAYTSGEIYAAIQASTLDASIKALAEEPIAQILKWMEGKTFSGVTIGNPKNEKITYQPED